MLIMDKLFKKQRKDTKTRGNLQVLLDKGPEYRRDNPVLPFLMKNSG
jgi:hypothetical protein